MLSAYIEGIGLLGPGIDNWPDGQRVLAGAAYYPAVDECLVAAPGAGCWWNGRRAAVSTVSTLDEATVLITDDRTFPDAPQRAGWQRLAAAARIARGWGDCYGYLLVATGRAEAMVDPIMNPWDAAAMYPIITEAGGRFTDWTGRVTAFGGDVIATNAALANEARVHLLEPRP